MSGLDDPVRGLSFSSDGRRLLTAGDSPEARLWDLSARPGELKAPEVKFQDPAIPEPSPARRSGPAPTRSSPATATAQVNLWSWKDGKAELDGLAPGRGMSSPAWSRRSPSPTTAGTWRRRATARRSGSARWRSDAGRVRGPRRAPAPPLRADQRAARLGRPDDADQRQRRHDGAVLGPRPRMPSGARSPRRRRRQAGMRTCRSRTSTGSSTRPTASSTPPPAARSSSGSATATRRTRWGIREGALPPRPGRPDARGQGPGRDRRARGTSPVSIVQPLRPDPRCPTPS